MAAGFILFQPGGGSDPKLLTEVVDTDKNAGVMFVTLSAAGTPETGGMLPIKSPGTANFATSAVTVTSSITQIVAARATRRSLLIIMNGTTQIFIGGAAVTTATGIPLVGIVGAYWSFNTVAAVSGRTASGTADIRVYEEYD